MSTEIDNMSFKELSEQIKQEYGTCYCLNMPMTLLRAL